MPADPDDQSDSGRATSPPAALAAVADEYVYDVPPHGSGVHRAVPGTQITYLATRAGEQVLLETHDLTVARLNTIRNIGTTLWIQCLGPGLGPTSSTPVGSYTGQNMLRREKRNHARLRWLFIAPEPGTYTFQITVSSYANLDEFEKRPRVQMKIASGARLVATPVGPPPLLSAEGVLEPAVTKATDEAIVAPGTTMHLLTTDHAFTTHGSRVRVLADLNLTTAQTYDVVKWPQCAAVGHLERGSDMTAALHLQPLDSHGTAVGRAVWSDPAGTYISNDRHHATLHVDLDVEKTRLGDCAAVRVSVHLRSSVIAGKGKLSSPVVYHSVRANNTAPSHLVIVEHA